MPTATVSPTPEPTATPPSQTAGLFEYSRAVRLLQIQELDRAIAAFDLVIRKLPEFARAYYGRGQAFLADERYELALEDFGKAIELEPKFPGSYVDRGKVFQEQGDIDAAIEDWNMAIEVSDPIRHANQISEAEELLASVEG